VSLEVCGTPFNETLPDRDTGVQCQPQDKEAQRADFRDDFIHARRCIAAAVKTEEEFRQALREQEIGVCAEVKPMTMRLMSREYDRGKVEVHPIDNESVNVAVIIGVGDNRYVNALPKEPWELAFKDIDASGTATLTERALKVLSAIGPDLLQALEERASH
jgi:hypothetical protein